MRRPVLLLALLAGLAASAGSSPASAQSLQPKTMLRVTDTIVAEGKVLGDAIRGAHKSRIRLYACRAGFMVPIQFQLDEKGPRGTYCWDQGVKERRTQDGDRGRIDSNDELVFLARESGDRARPDQLGQVPAYTAVDELEIRDPLTGGRSWVYVYRFEGGPILPRPTTDLARIRIRIHDEDSGTYQWFGERFAFNNDRSRINAARATYAAVARPGTRDFSGMQSLIDSTQVKAVVSFMWITVTRHSPEFALKIGGYIDGPLRVITENLLQVYLGLGLWVKAPESYIILWRNRVTMPTNADCPVNLDESDESSYTLCVDLAKRTKGWRFFNSHNPEPVEIDGKTSQAEKDLDLTFPDWNCVYGPEGALVNKFVIPKFLAKRKASQLVYIDDAALDRDLDEGVEFEKGCVGYNGFKMDMAGLKKGLYPGDYICWYGEPGFQPGDQVALLNEYDHPLVVRSTTLASER